MNIYAYLTPIVVVFVILEIVACLILRRKYITFQEAIANFGTAVGSQTTNLLIAAFVYTTYGYLWNNFRLIEGLDIGKPLHFIILLVSIDFIFYWVHRWGHEVNILWAAHSPHHSGEDFNFLIALRASVTQRLVAFLFFWPLTIIGFSPQHIYVMSGIHLFISFFHHTEFVPKLWKWFEFVFNTPSHHRVHHGVNFKYLDRNYSEFLIIWDRIFGTFTEETEKPVYGMYNGPKSWNPILINFHYYLVLFETAKKAPYFLDKIKIWFMPLTWMPRGLDPKPPLVEVTPTNQVRFETKMLNGAVPYLILQSLVGVVLMYLIIDPNTHWLTWQRWIGSFVLWMMIINWGGILESKKWVFASELIRIVAFSAIIIFFSYEQTILMYSVLAVNIFSLIWTLIYFKNEQPRALKLVKG